MDAFTHRGLIENKLKETVDSLVEKNNLPIVFGHLAWGKLSEIGSLRLSYVKRNEAFTDSLLSKNVFFNKHIKQVGRNKTFLDFLLLYWFDRKDFIGLKANSKFTFLIRKQPELIIEQEDKIIINTRLSDVLAPIKLIDHYFKILDDDFSFIPNFTNLQDNDRHEIKTYHLNELDSCRFKALALFSQKKLKTEYNKLVELSKKYKSTGFENINIVHLLGAIQSALLFIKGSYPKEKLIGFISCSTAHKANGENSILRNPIIVLSTPILQSDTVHNHNTLNSEEVQIEIEKFYRNHEFDNTESICDIINEDVEKYIPKDKIKEKIDDKLIEYELFKIKPDWSKFILYWNSILIQYLRNSIHEGSSLNFTFVVADASEIKDCGLFDIVELKFKSNTKDIFHPYNQGKKLDKDNFSITDFGFLYVSTNGKTKLNDKILIKHIKRNIEKKNYSWFQDGKYALLWDSTFPSKFPHSLIKIKNSSWEVIINEVRNQKCKDLLSNISLSLVFLKQDQSGGLIIKDNLVASFRKGLPWSFGLDEKGEKVKEYLEIGFNGFNTDSKSELIKLMTDVLLSISDDPHSGCILVISDVKPEFASMGDPWQIVPKNTKETEGYENLNPVNLSKDELAALMGMDGATCIYMVDQKPIIKFRNILMIEENKLKRNFPKEELDGEGSRKWSSLNTARLDNINLVVAVSQDGPIYIYEPIKVKESEEVKINIL